MASRSQRATAVDTVFDRRGSSRDKASPRKRRATSDGREPLVVYMLPESIKALKIAAVEQDTTASAIVTAAVDAWMKKAARGGAK